MENCTLIMKTPTSMSLGKRFSPRRYLCATMGHLEQCVHKDGTILMHVSLARTVASVSQTTVSAAYLRNNIAVNIVNILCQLCIVTMCNSSCT